MPRRNTHELTLDHVHLPPEQRRPRLPRNLRDTWVIDTYRVRTWYYRAAPAIGDVVRYMDGSITTVVGITATRVKLGNSLTMRRPYATARLITWSTTNLNTWLTSRYGRGTVNPQKATKYAMDQVTLYV